MEDMAEWQKWSPDARGEGARHGDEVEPLRIRELYPTRLEQLRAEGIPFGHQVALKL